MKSVPRSDRREPNRFRREVADTAVGPAFEACIEDLELLYGPVKDQRFWAAPSAVCRSELAFLGLGFPRFSYRCAFEKSADRGRGFCSFRRINNYRSQISHLPIAAETEEGVRVLAADDVEYQVVKDRCTDLVDQSNPLVESVLPVPPHLAPRYWSIARDFQRVFGTSEPCYGTAYTSMLEFGGGVCSQAVIFLASLHLENYAKSILTPAEISRELFSKRHSDGTVSTAIRGFFQEDYSKYFTSERVQLQSHELRSKLVYGNDQSASNPLTRLTNLIPYLRSGFSAIWTVDVEKYLECVHHRTTQSSGLAHALLVCGVSHQEPLSFLIHDPSLGPYIEISADALATVKRAGLADTRDGVTMNSIVPCPPNLRLHYSGGAANLVKLHSHRRYQSDQAQLRSRFPRLADHIDETKLLRPREVVLLDRASLTLSSLAEHFPDLPKSGLAQTVEAIAKLPDKNRLLWLNAVTIERTRRYSVLAWIADEECDAKTTLYDKLALIVANEQLEYSPAFPPKPTATPKPDEQPETLDDGPPSRQETRPVEVSLITSYSARALTTSLRHWPHRDVAPELYCFMLLDSHFIAKLLGDRTPAGIGSTPDTVASLLARVADSDDDLKQIAMRISKFLKEKGVPKPIGIASFIPQLSSLTCDLATNVPIQFFKAITQIAIYLKRDFGCRKLSVIEFVGGSTTSHLSQGHRTGTAPKPGGLKQPLSLSNGFLVNWERSTQQGHELLIRSLEYVTASGIGDQLRSERITLAAEIEPGDYNLLSTLESVSSFLQRADDNGLGDIVSLNLDIGHAAILRSQYETPSDFDDELRGLMPLVSHAHISHHYLKCHFSDAAFLFGVPEVYQTLLRDYCGATWLRQKNGGVCSGHVSVEIEASETLEQVQSAIKTVKSMLAQIN